MAESGKYLIGESLREKLKSTIAKVDSIPFGGPVSRIPTILDGGGPSSSAKVFRVCTFTGSWAINTNKELTFRGVTSTPNTVSATNIFLALPDRGSQPCGIAKDGTAWHLIAYPPVTEQTAVLTSVSLGTAGLQFTRMNITILGTVSSSVITISTTDCT